MVKQQKISLLITMVYNLITHPTMNLAFNAGYILLSGLDKDVELDLDVDDNKANLWYAGGKYNFDKM